MYNVKRCWQLREAKIIPVIIEAIEPDENLQSIPGSPKTLVVQTTALKRTISILEKAQECNVQLWLAGGPQLH